MVWYDAAAADDDGDGYDNRSLRILQTRCIAVQKKRSYIQHVHDKGRIRAILWTKKTFPYGRRPDGWAMWCLLWPS